jgi:hypothetical protein
MPKISLEEVQSALQASKVEPKQQEDILKYLNQVVQEIQEEKENNKEPKIKKDWGVILIDEMNEIKTDNISALVYQIPTGDDHNLVLNKIKAAIHDFNAQDQKNPITSISQAFCYIKPKLLKEKGVFRKTKELTTVIKTSNKLT